MCRLEAAASDGPRNCLEDWAAALDEAACLEGEAAQSLVLQAALTTAAAAAAAKEEEEETSQPAARTAQAARPAGLLLQPEQWPGQLLSLAVVVVVVVVLETPT